MVLVPYPLQITSTGWRTYITPSYKHLAHLSVSQTMASERSWLDAPMPFHCLDVSDDDSTMITNGLNVRPRGQGNKFAGRGEGERRVPVPFSFGATKATVLAFQSMSGELGSRANMASCRRRGMEMPCQSSYGASLPALYPSCLGSHTMAPYFPRCLSEGVRPRRGAWTREGGGPKS
jgi:hypothetical protein